MLTVAYNYEIVTIFPRSLLSSKCVSTQFTACRSEPYGVDPFNYPAIIT